MCAICGIYDPDHQAARLLHPALFSMQHRGQESTGIAAGDRGKLRIHKGMGLVAHVYSEAILKRLGGTVAIGHNRYSTSHGSTLEHAQPVINAAHKFAFAHNGNLPTTHLVEQFLKGHKQLKPGRNDSEMMTDVIAYYLSQGDSIETAMTKSYQLFTGAFSAVFIHQDKLGAIRDPRGIRPLSLGKLNGFGYIIASETCALETLGANFLRDVKPGEMIIIDKNGLSAYQLAKGKEQLDIFEFVYFARPDSMLLGKSVNQVRFNFGVQLAHEFPVKADVVIPVPDTGTPAAEGYAAASGIPMRQGFAKNRYIHRTFIQPDQRLREKGVELKLNPLPDVIAGKDVVLVEDSIVRGTTASRLVKMLKNAGAKKVYFLVTSPPVRYPDFYGIDTPRQGELIGATHTIPQIEAATGADRLYYLSYQGMIRATGLKEASFNTSCFTGNYAIDIGERQKEIHMFAQEAKRKITHAENDSGREAHVMSL